MKKIVQHSFKTDKFFINKAIEWALMKYSKINKEWLWFHDCIKSKEIL